LKATFSGFKRADKEVNRVLLLDILLNGHSLEEIEKVEEVTEHYPFAGINRKVVRVYGLTREAIDVQEIYKERANIIAPTLCSLQTYEMCSTSDTAYWHKSRNESQPLTIHDLGVISRYMVITPEVVVSSKKAKTITEDCEYGFTSFMEYIINGSFKIGNWFVEYDNKNKKFSIYYTSTIGSANTELVYQSEEYNKDATFSLVLYLIKKVYADIIENEKEEFKSDCFIVERWIREKGK